MVFWALEKVCMLVTFGSGPRDVAEAWCFCSLWQLEQQTTLYTQGQNDLDARTREYEAAKQALAEHHTNHENAARFGITRSWILLMLEGPWSCTWSGPGYTWRLGKMRAVVTGEKRVFSN